MYWVLFVNNTASTLDVVYPMKSTTDEVAMQHEVVIIDTCDRLWSCRMQSELYQAVERTVRIKTKLYAISDT